MKNFLNRLGKFLDDPGSTSPPSAPSTGEPRASAQPPSQSSENRHSMAKEIWVGGGALLGSLMETEDYSYRPKLPSWMADDIKVAKDHLSNGNHSMAVRTMLPVVEQMIRLKVEGNTDTGHYSEAPRASVEELITIARNRGDITSGNLMKLERWWSLRDRLNHGPSGVSRKEARDMVDGVSEIIYQFYELDDWL